jgi:hypothetical protein
MQSSMLWPTLPMPYSAPHDMSVVLGHGTVKLTNMEVFAYTKWMLSHILYISFNQCFDELKMNEVKGCFCLLNHLKLNGNNIAIKVYVNEYISYL